MHCYQWTQMLKLFRKNILKFDVNCWVFKIAHFILRVLSTFISLQRTDICYQSKSVFWMCFSWILLLASSCKHFHQILRQIIRKLFLLKYPHDTETMAFIRYTHHLWILWYIFLHCKCTVESIIGTPSRKMTLKYLIF